MACFAKKDVYFCNMLERIFKRMLGCIMLLCVMSAGSVQLMAKSKLPEGKDLVSDTLMHKLFEHAANYYNSLKEYKGEQYYKANLHVFSRNPLIKHIPGMFKVDRKVKDYIMETLSDIHYTAPDMHDTRIKYRRHTLRRDKGELTDMSRFFQMNVYSASLMTDKLLSPLDVKAASNYYYLMDTVMIHNERTLYRIHYIPRFKNTQLIEGEIDVYADTYHIIRFAAQGMFDLVNFNIEMYMGTQGNEMLVPKRMRVEVDFKYLGNHMTLKGDVWSKYARIKTFENEGERLQILKNHPQNRTDFFSLSLDTSKVYKEQDGGFFGDTPIHLTDDDRNIYAEHTTRLLKAKNDTVRDSRRKAFWNRMGDLGEDLLTGTTISSPKLGSLKFNPFISPVMLEYTHSKGFTYKQKWRYNMFFKKSERSIQIVPRVGFNFTHREAYIKSNSKFVYFPQKLGSLELEVTNASRVHSVNLQQHLAEVVDKDIDYSRMSKNYFRDFKIRVNHVIEPFNGFMLHLGVNMHYRYLKKNRLMREMPEVTEEDMERWGLLNRYNTFGPNLRIAYTPAQVYYMNGKRKTNLGSVYPTMIFDYERGLKGVLNSNCSYERMEFDVQHKIKLRHLHTIAYRVGVGMFTKQDDNLYIMEYANFKRHSIPEGWNDRIGGSFWSMRGTNFSTPSKYLRANVSYESPLILMRSSSPILSRVNHERIYGGMVLGKGQKPFFELGYGIGTLLFDVGLFVGLDNGKELRTGWRFIYELFKN